MDSQYIGAKFYSKSDLSIGWNLEKAEKIINVFDETNTGYTINNILEMYNICLLIDSKVMLRSWSEEYYRKLTSVANSFRPIIGRFFSDIDYLCIKTFYHEISIHYRDSFWDVFETYKIYKNISSEEFINLLEIFNVPLYIILEHKDIVQYYNNEISDYMKQSKSTAEILISHHLASKERNHKTCYIPKALQTDQQIDIIEKYIDREDANPNYLFLLSKSRGTKEFPISDKIRLKSKRQHERIVDKNFESGTGFSFGAIVGFSNNKEEIDVSYEDELNPKIIYSRLWLEENLDNPTLLNNFIYLFGYVDRFFRSTFPSNKNHLGILERLVGVKGNREYEIGASFSFKEMISSLQIRAYYYELSKLDKRLEDIFKWFFEEYLNTEFQAEGFSLLIPSSESSFLEKMRTMCSELDSVLRQFMFFVNNGEIDVELLEISRNSPLMEEVPSFFVKKYGYIVDTELLNISYLLFSDQSELAYVENKKDYNNFADLIKNEDMLFSDFFEYQLLSLNWLKDKNIIYEDNHRYIRFRMEIVRILEDFYNNDVICLSYYKNSDLLDELITNKKIIFESTLFSKPERDYLNYILNDRQFDNGPSIRNKYLHGNNPQSIEEHESDYYQLLKIFALIVIKINEEFCLKDDLINDDNL
jgi:hypothetical protein